MAERQNNKGNLLGYALMGMGGGLAGQDFIGAYQSMQKAKQIDWEQEHFKKLALGENYISPEGVEPASLSEYGELQQVLMWISHLSTLPYLK